MFQLSGLFCISLKRECGGFKPAGGFRVQGLGLRIVYQSRLEETGCGLNTKLTLTGADPKPKAQSTFIGASRVFLKPGHHTAGYVPLMIHLRCPTPHLKP